MWYLDVNILDPTTVQRLDKEQAQKLLRIACPKHDHNHGDTSMVCVVTQRNRFKPYCASLVQLRFEFEQGEESKTRSKVS